MKNYIRKANFDWEGKRYIRSEQIKDKRSTVSGLLLSFSASLLTFFSAHHPKTNNNPQQIIAIKGASLTLWIYWLLFTFRNHCQTFFYGQVFFFLKRLILIDSQQKEFCIHRFTFIISKLVTTLEVRIRHWVDKKAWWRLRRYGILYVKSTVLGYGFCQKNKSGSYRMLKTQILDLFETSVMSNQLLFIS